MRIDIFSDTICPWCFIGKRRLEKALAAWTGPRPEVVWRPFQLNPGMPPDGMDRGAYLALKFGGVENARRVSGAVSRAGAAEGLPFAFDAIARTPNTLDSHRLVRLAREPALLAADDSPDAAQHRIVEKLFNLYFIEGADLGKIDTLVTAAEACGLDAAAVRLALSRETGRAEIAEEDRQARAMGIQGVPFFVFDGTETLSGAQPPEVLLQLLELSAARAADAATIAGATARA